MNVINTRKANHEIDPLYIKRWSPRAFSEKPVETEKLNRIFEAARWAPSAANRQPWRFIIAKTAEDRKRFLGFINKSNVEWCHRAPVLMVVASKKVYNDAGDPNYFHTFDTGTAWGYLSLEAARQGLIAHGMGGFNPESAKVELNISDEYDVQAVVAIGYHDPNAELSERNRSREVPSDRIPIEQFVFEGNLTE